MPMESREIYCALKDIYYFSGLSDDQLAELSRTAYWTHFDEGNLLFSQGDPANAMFAILAGRVQLYKISRDGKQFILHIFGPGELFAEVPVFSDIPYYPAYAIALEPTDCIGFKAGEFRQMVMAQPLIALATLSVFARRLHEFSALLEDLSLRTVDGRLARYLISVADNATGSAAIHVQKQTLASILGTIPETLSRTFKKLSADGLIDVKGSSIKILDRAALNKLAS